MAKCIRNLFSRSTWFTYDDDDDSSNIVITGEAERCALERLVHRALAVAVAAIAAREIVEPNRAATTVRTNSSVGRRWVCRKVSQSIENSAYRFTFNCSRLVFFLNIHVPSRFTVFTFLFSKDLVLDGDVDTAEYQIDRLLGRFESTYKLTDEKSIIHFAVLMRNVKMLRMLIDKGCQPILGKIKAHTWFYLKFWKKIVDQRDVLSGQTPFHFALFSGSREILRLLAQHDVNAELCDNYYGTVFDYARMLDYLPQQSNQKNSICVYLK